MGGKWRPYTVVDRAHRAIEEVGVAEAPAPVELNDRSSTRGGYIARVELDRIRTVLRGDAKCS